MVTLFLFLGGMLVVGIICLIPAFHFHVEAERVAHEAMRRHRTDRFGFLRIVYNENGYPDYQSFIACEAHWGVPGLILTALGCIGLPLLALLQLL